MFCSCSVTLGTSLFWPFTTPMSYQPVDTSTSLRSFSTSRVLEQPSTDTQASRQDPSNTFSRRARMAPL